MPFIVVAGAGFMAESCYRYLITEVHLLPRTASVGGSVVAMTDQWRGR
ncbi:hypothetical protein HMPREF1549_03357 [Actinomyces johnsonii F0510]|uniref:Uncharacterized protein n=1 Tax=Actinomyces johnsonii F0510 TaxID=1227262 RepID=U1PXB2_9ACTO|nr:hypothetical protein HMPREF1549_03357 [Actinomyces johnsonii F0510]